jgi:CPA2 family monovalent cation:H+ antiporter-2
MLDCDWSSDVCSSDLAMGPVIASIHQKREDLREGIKEAASMEQAPRLRRLKADETP